MLRATLCELPVSVGFVCLYFYGDGTSLFHFHGTAYSYLLVLLVSLTAFEAAAHAWRLLMYFDLATIYRNPFHPNRHRHWYPLFVLVVALMSSFGAASRCSSRRSTSSRPARRRCFCSAAASSLCPLCL